MKYLFGRETFHQMSQNSDGTLDQRTPRMAAVEADEILMVAPGRKQESGRNADARRPGLPAEYHGIHAFGQFTPEHKTTHGPRQANVFRKGLHDGFAHPGHLMPIFQAKGTQITVVTAIS